MILRLDPAVPLVWRDPQTLQFGVDPVLAVLDDVTPVLERLVSALVTGVTEEGFAALTAAECIRPARRDHLLALLDAFLLRCPEPETTAAAAVAAAAVASVRRAVVLGTGPLAVAVARMLDELSLRTTEPSRATFAVLVADHVVLPADHRPWLQRDIPHLPLIATDTAITIGPLVAPGRSACLHCVDLHRRDTDPAWPAIAAQLARHPAPVWRPVRTASAAVHAVRIVARALHGTAEPGRELRVAGDGEQLSERAIAPHPECHCATPPENDWARADESASPPEASAARASSGRA